MPPLGCQAPSALSQGLLPSSHAVLLGSLCDVRTRSRPPSCRRPSSALTNASSARVLGRVVFPTCLVRVCLPYQFSEVPG